MTNDNLKLWDRHADIDPKMTKGITGKDYKGTSPNAHHIIWCLTDLFGPVGVGFGWRVLTDQVEHFGDTAIHWCRIEFWHTDRANTFESYGQTKMAYMTRGDAGYLKVDEDAPKKSLTDAITKAAAQIGVASNIFLGRWDDNKYVQGVANDFAKRNAPQQPDEAEIAKNIIADVDAARGDKAELTRLWGNYKSIMASMSDDNFDAVKKAFEAAAPKAEPEPKTNADLDDEIPF